MDKEEWFKEKHEMARCGFVDHEMCIYYEEFAFPRERDFDSWCDKRNNYIKNINVDSGCEYFDMGDIDDWDY